jgi:hypothetical protein
MNRFSISVTGFCEGDHEMALMHSLDHNLEFETPAQLAAWVRKHLGDGGPGGLIDVARIEREARETLARLTKKATRRRKGAQ